jgi:prenyltransferase beta subunit
MCGLASTPGLFDLSGEWLSSCQTFEGGFGGEPGCEAHVRCDAILGVIELFVVQ